jgi:hypothetical protein
MLAVPAVLTASSDFVSLRVNVDQSFRAGQADLPAGAYSIRVLTLANGQPSLEFTSARGHSVLVPAAHFTVEEEAKESRLVFDHEDGSLVLHRIWVAGTLGGFDIIGAR